MFPERPDTGVRRKKGEHIHEKKREKERKRKSIHLHLHPNSD